MLYVQLIAILAVLQYLVIGKATGTARASSGLKAPAMTGHDGFERMYRVQMNTLETLVAFLPALFLAAVYWPSYLVVILGLAYLVGRTIYWRAYVANPPSRYIGFMVSIIPTIALAVLALVGNVLTIFGVMG
jgi:uncharacterized MAPEG superfamily protein